jgi:hypothetical protein
MSRLDMRRVKSLEVRAVLDTLKSVKRFVVDYGDIANALRRIVSGDEYWRVEERLYHDVVTSALAPGVYTYRILRKDYEHRNEEVVVITTTRLNGDQLKVLREVAKLYDQVDLAYDEFCECRDPYGMREKGGAISEVIHNLVQMWTGDSVYDVIDALEKVYKSL